MKSTSNNLGDRNTEVKRAKAGRARALEIKTLQERALARLPPLRLYIVLHIRNDPPVANNFHWGLYYHKNASGGTKYHVTNLTTGWIPNHGQTGGLFKSQFLCTLVQIASIPADREQLLDQKIRTFDNNVNSIAGVTCRVWVMRVVDVLVQNGLVHCNNLPSLEAECMGFGNQHMSTAATNVQPRPVEISRFSS